MADSSLRTRKPREHGPRLFGRRGRFRVSASPNSLVSGFTALFVDPLWPGGWRFRYAFLCIDGVGITNWPRLPERVQVRLFRQQELEERLSLEAARLGDGQQQQVLRGDPFGERI